VEALTQLQASQHALPGWFTVDKVMICCQLIVLAMFQTVNKLFWRCKGSGAAAPQHQQQHCCSTPAAECDLSSAVIAVNEALQTLLCMVCCSTRF
jgi:hypothetical protein